MRVVQAIIALACVVGAAEGFSVPSAMLGRARVAASRIPALRSNLAAAPSAALHLKGGSRIALPSFTRFPPLAWISPVTRRVVGALRGSAGLKATAAAVDAPVEKFRKDYKQTDFIIKDIDLTFQINDGSTTVLSKLQMSRRDGVEASCSMRLDAEDLDLKSVKVNGELLSADRYSFPEKDVLEIKGPFPEGKFELETEVVIKPEENTQLSGLYKSSGMYCTQV